MRNSEFSCSTIVGYLRERGLILKFGLPGAPIVHSKLRVPVFAAALSLLIAETCMLYLSIDRFGWANTSSGDGMFKTAVLVLAAGIPTMFSIVTMCVGPMNAQLFAGAYWNAREPECLDVLLTIDRDIWLSCLLILAGSVSLIWLGEVPLAIVNLLMVIVNFASGLLQQRVLDTN